MTKLRTILEKLKSCPAVKDGEDICPSCNKYIDEALDRLRSAMKEIVPKIEDTNWGDDSECVGAMEIIRQIHARIEEQCK